MTSGEAGPIFGRSRLVVADATIITAAEKILAHGKAAQSEQLALRSNKLASFRCPVAVLDQSK